MPTKIFALAIFLLAQLTFADTCPRVSDIKHHKIPGWHIYDSDDGKKISAKRAQQYKNDIQQFALAESIRAQNKTTIHCYYRDNNGSQLEAYLAKENLMPLNNKNHWYTVSGAMQCAAGSPECEFQTDILRPRSQLAKR